MVGFPEPADRWLRPLGLAMIALSAIPFTPVLHEGGRGATPFPGYLGAVALSAVPVGIFGLALAARRNASPARFFAGLAVVVIVVSDILFSATLFEGGRPFVIDAYMALNTISWTLWGVAQPYLWGSALVRREHPECVAAWKAGRVSAVALITSFGLGLVAEIVLFSAYPSMPTSMFSQDAISVLMTLLSFGARVLLFWSAVESLRRSREASAIQSRADRIHRLMAVVTFIHAATLLTTMAQALLSPSSGPYSRPFAWNSAVRLVLLLAATALLAGRYRASPDLGPRWTAPPPLLDEAA